MTAVSLDHVQALVDQLPLRDQVRLMQHLTQRIATRMLDEEGNRSSTADAVTLTELWRQFDHPSAARSGTRTASEELFATRR